MLKQAVKLSDEMSDRAKITAKMVTRARPQTLKLKGRNPSSEYAKQAPYT